MFWYGNVINTSPEKDLEICSQAFIDKDYSEGLEALQRLGKSRQVYRMELNTVGESTYMNAYKELATQYFNVDPAKVSNILFKNQNRVQLNTNADAFRKQTFNLITSLSYDLINTDAGTEEYRNDAVKRLSLGSDNLASVFTWTQDKSLVSDVAMYADRLIDEGGYVQGVNSYSIMMGSSKFYYRDGDYRGEKDIARRFMNGLIACSGKVSEEELGQVRKIAKKRKGLLNQVEDSGYNKVMENLKPLDERIPNEETIKAAESVQRVKALLGGQKVV